MNFSEELAMAGELELTDSELETVSGGHGQHFPWWWYRRPYYNYYPQYGYGYEPYGYYGGGYPFFGRGYGYGDRDDRGYGDRDHHGHHGGYDRD